MSQAYLAYPVVVVLALAAFLPIAAPSVFLDAVPADARAAAPRAAAPIVVSTGGVTLASAAPAPAEYGPAGSDERWWRRPERRATTTTSVVSVPSPAAEADRGGAPPERGEANSRASQVVRATMAEIRLTSRVPAQIRRWEPLILKAARKHDLDPALIAAVMMTESSGNPEAISPVGAIGLMQVLGGPADPEANIDVGAGMLSNHLRRFGSIDLALAAYNAGIGNVLEHGGVPPFQETRDHIARTLASYTAWRAV